LLTDEYSQEDFSEIFSLQRKLPPKPLEKNYGNVFRRSGAFVLKRF